MREAVSLLRPVLDESGTLVDLEVRWANAAWRRRVVGAEGPGGLCFALLPDLARQADLPRAVWAGAESGRLDVAFPDGSLCDIEMTRFEDGILLVGRDVTARRAVEESLRQSRSELVEAQRIARVGTWSYIVAPEKVVWSEDVFRLYGLEPASQAPPWSAQRPLYAPGSYDALAEAVARTLQTGEPYEVHIDIVHPGGEVRHAISRGEATRDARGAVVGLSGTVVDVTELRRVQSRLHQAERADLVGRLAAGVAHEFNNLLQTIDGNAEGLAERIAPGDPGQADLESIRRAVERAAALTRQLLAFGRGQTLEPVVLDPVEVVSALVPMLRSLVGEAVPLEIVLEPGAGKVRADRSLLEQVITTLVLHARDSACAGGRVALKVDRFDGEAGGRHGPGGSFVRLSVSDTGSGIAPEVLPRIFEPFVASREIGRGSGLGLSSVEGAVSQSGGFVTALSTLGSGSTFSIHLPRSREERPAARPAPVRASVPEATVLVVDDEPEVRNITSRLLRSLGYSVVDVGDPLHAVALSQAGTAFDVLLTDVMMPGLNGRELAHRLCGLRPGLPVVYMSGYSTEALFRDGILERGTPFLSKPFLRDELAARVREALEARRPSAPGVVHPA